MSKLTVLEINSDVLGFYRCEAESAFHSDQKPNQGSPKNVVQFVNITEAGLKSILHFLLAGF